MAFFRRTLTQVNASTQLHIRSSSEVLSRPPGKEQASHRDEASDVSSKCLPCRKGCPYCLDDTPCLVLEDGALRLAVASFQGLCMVLDLACMVVVYHFRRAKVRLGVRGSPCTSAGHRGGGVVLGLWEQLQKRFSDNVQKNGSGHFLSSSPFAYDERSKRLSKSDVFTPTGTFLDRSFASR